jgi:putative tryptophan/tyrosine transport system substrate-binding protein
MRRREFITLIGGAAALGPLAARAQQPARMWRIGFVAGGARPVPLEGSSYAGFLQGMREFGYAAGRDFTIEWRFAEGRYELFPEYAAEFARSKMDVIVTALTAAVIPMRHANSTTPIVMGYSVDPVGAGIVANLGRPGGNVTGLASAVEDITGKQMDLLKTALPNLSRIGVVLNPTNPTTPFVLKSVTAAAEQNQLSVVPVHARSAQEIESAFDILIKENAGAALGIPDAFFFAQRQRIAEVALKHRMPSIFGNREYAQAGALMSYGDSLQEFYRRAAAFVDKILKGAKPDDLPIELPTKYNLVINRRTADVLRVPIPAQLYIFADEVIE